MKKLSRNEMRKVLGGNPEDKKCIKCCDAQVGGNCGPCNTGQTCASGAFERDCPQNPDGTCAPD